MLNLKQDDANYAYLYDGRGNVEIILDNTQAIVAQYLYDPFGSLLAQSGTLEQPFGFSTKRYDAATGLVYYGRRFYSPAMDHWTTRDPLGEHGGLNLYAFVGNNPVNWVDPWGLATGAAAVYDPCAYELCGGGSGGRSIGRDVAGAGVGLTVAALLGQLLNACEGSDPPYLMASREHGETYLTRQVLDLAKQTGQNPCDILTAMQETEESKGRSRDTKLLQEIKKAQKLLGCRRHRRM